MSGKRRSRSHSAPARHAIRRLLPTWTLLRQRVGPNLNKIVIGLLVLVLGSPLTIWLSLADANIVYVGEKPPTVTGMQSQWKEDKFVAHFSVEPLFMNKSFKPGHIENVKVAPLGLTPYPENVEVIYLDRRRLWWHETRNIRCDFIVVINRKDVIRDGPALGLQIAYHDAGGNQIYWHSEHIQFYTKLPPGGRLVEPPPFKR
jgi:hypothetical protein